MRLSWDKLLCDETIAAKEKTPSSWVDYPMDPFEQDYREIISSGTFRRLQDKTQVYQLSQGDYVRTRLTHSLEVSTVAKQLGIMLVYNEKWNRVTAFKDLPIGQGRSIPTVLACAGLLHDMGNPPFGHEGEHSIGRWFRQNLGKDDFVFMGKPIRDVLTPAMKADLCNFEGNAQVIRLLSKCRFPSDEREANVSYATISTLIKYPTDSLGMNPGSDDLRVHKYGYYLTETELVRKIREKTGLDLPDEPNARNPLTYLLEAADDIAYAASDLEDALVKKMITVSWLVRFMKKKIEELPRGGDEMQELQVLTAEGALANLEKRLATCGEDEVSELMVFRQWTSYLRNWFMYVAAKSFVNNWEPIMNGSYRGELLSDSHHKYTVAILKDAMKTTVYPQLDGIHITACNILGNLMECFGRAVIAYDSPMEMDFQTKNYIGVIPKAFKKTYQMERTNDEEFNLYLRFRMISDFVSNMTDGFALDLYKQMNALG